MWRRKALAAAFLTLSLGYSEHISEADPVILIPKHGTLIEDRRNFPVEVSIPGYVKNSAANFHFWVSLAMGKDDLRVHWPKFYVKAARFTAPVHDGGHNPLPEKQPMTILLLRVDDSTNQRFVAWLKKGAPYDGLEVTRSEIVARALIYFR